MKNICLILLAVITLYACNNDDYLVDGGLSQQQVNATTFDFLQSHKQLDTLAMLIDKAGLKDQLNGETTLFAPNNASINNYVDRRLTELRNEDPQATFTVNDIHVDTLKKYMGAYIFSGKITREDMTEQGEILTALNGEQRRISLQPTNQYSGQLETFPKYVYYTYKVGDTWEPTSDVNKDDKDVLVRTSNILTTNGVVHVLQGSHILFNYDN
ncbi:fasciclin domain-containing protein [Aureibaculum sp. 2210JD6-5]|uniref:fasciclin domain-containing protein n=1 Tax=Aureibaculum sp. 2210JD6-5 TaxID=3103957 RepID=UPI002AAC7D21|nr:fasciclin domain-containing protein [Aureibaculum sp. 2210JD6-5]MDY7394598.1 fasciclin domain-containing protein [Aureibaculum sp. 2210JD6-5]